jgi:hypothetical protein
MGRSSVASFPEERTSVSRSLCVVAAAVAYRVKCVSGPLEAQYESATAAHESVLFMTEARISCL